jgi:hypothetical protein
MKQDNTKKAVVQLDSYTGYRHNRYDGFNCSWGVLMALGASQRADCFTDADDSPDEEFEVAFMGEDDEIGTGDNDDFRETVLQNLDDQDIEDVEELQDGDEASLCQYWGDYKININIKKTNSRLWCTFDGKGPFEVKL